MTPDGLRSGDKVVELAALARTVGLVTGAVTAAVLFWPIRKSWLASGTALVPGAVVGLAVAAAVAAVLYRAPGGSTIVVKAGRGALAVTVPAGLAVGLATAMIVNGLAVLFFAPVELAIFLLVMSSVCGVLIGTVVALLASLL